MGKLIAIDGLDGSGKETQTTLLLQKLQAEGREVRMLSFPCYGTQGCTLVEAYLSGKLGEDPSATNAYAASAFFAMDRYFSYRTDWGAFYRRPDTILLANRYTTANAVHQLSKLSESGWESFLTWLWDFEFGKLGLPQADEVLYLEVPPAVSHALIDARSQATGRTQDIHERHPLFLEESYRAALYASERLGWKRISCAPDAKMRSREDIHREICDYLQI